MPPLRGALGVERRRGPQPTTERLTALAGLVDAGIIKPNVGRVFPLDQAAAAFTHFESGNARGKVVVAV